MLYERWRKIARLNQDEIALRDLPSNRQWTFRDLAAIAENREPESRQKIIFPRGNSAEFIFSILRAWRDGAVVCPLESEQHAPEISSELPAGVVHLKTTSASTGAARMIAFTAEQLAADAENIVATMGLRPDWPNLGVISLAHSYGFSNLVTPLLLHGIPLILGGAPLPETIRRAAASEQNIALAAVPALWRNWHDADAIPRNVRLAISAGAPLPVPLEQNIFAMRGLKIHNFYGASECGGIAFDAASTPRLDPSVAGMPMKNVSVSLAEDGCLEVRSGAVGLTYWPDAQPNLRDGVFRTSDLAEISFEMIYLRGRASDQINVAGRKISPETIEKILATHPAVRDCLVFGVPSSDADRGEKIVAIVALRTETSAETLKHFLLEKLPAWQVPREWRFVPSLEVNERGKLSRAGWKSKYLENGSKSVGRIC
jgi:long-chain acyl-CoA synthetase